MKYFRLRKVWDTWRVFYGKQNDWHGFPSWQAAWDYVWQEFDAHKARIQYKAWD